MSADPEDFDMYMANVEETCRKHDEETRRAERERVLQMIEASVQAWRSYSRQALPLSNVIDNVIARIREGK